MKALLLYSNSADDHPNYPAFTTVNLTWELILNIRKDTGYPVIISDMKSYPGLIEAYRLTHKVHYLYKLQNNTTDIEFEDIMDSTNPYPVIEIYNDDREGW